MTEFFFWLSGFVMFYTYFGYPIILWVSSKLLSSPVNKKEMLPNVSFVVVVHNEEEYIEEKIQNILSCDYPKEKLEVIIGSDGSTDDTNKIIERHRDKGIKVYIFSKHVGKVNILNEITPKVSGEIIVFSDARQILKKNAIKELVNNFSDDQVGCVSGELILKNESSLISEGVGFYWDYEKFIRKKESDIGSMVGATGAIYAIRKGLYISPAEDTVLDDVFIPLKIIEQGFRVIFDTEAIAYDKMVFSSKEEYVRKVRTLAGNFQIFSRCKSLFDPFKSKIAWQLFSHKFLRAFMFFFLITLFVTNTVLIGSYPYNLIFFLQIIFYLLAFMGWGVEKLGRKGGLLSFPYIFCILNLAALKGFLKFVFGKQKVTWKEDMIR